MKKFLLIILSIVLYSNVFSQTKQPEETIFYINVFINSTKEVRVERDLVKIENISRVVKKTVYEHPFKLDERIVYRIFADKNLLLDYIMDVEDKMFRGYNNNTQRVRYLLETVEMELDGPNWLIKFEGINFENIKG